MRYMQVCAPTAHTGKTHVERIITGNMAIHHYSFLERNKFAQQRQPAQHQFFELIKCIKWACWNGEGNSETIITQGVNPRVISMYVRMHVIIIIWPLFCGMQDCPQWWWGAVASEPRENNWLGCAAAPGPPCFLDSCSCLVERGQKLFPLSWLGKIVHTQKIATTTAKADQQCECPFWFSSNNNNYCTTPHWHLRCVFLMSIGTVLVGGLVIQVIQKKKFYNSSRIYFALTPPADHCSSADVCFLALLTLLWYNGNKEVAAEHELIFCLHSRWLSLVAITSHFCQSVVIFWVNLHGINNYPCPSCSACVSIIITTI